MKIYNYFSSDTPTTKPLPSSNSLSQRLKNCLACLFKPSLPPKSPPIKVTSIQTKSRRSELFQEELRDFQNFDFSQMSIENYQFIGKRSFFRDQKLEEIEIFYLDIKNSNCKFGLAIDQEKRYQLFPVFLTKDQEQIQIKKRTFSLHNLSNGLYQEYLSDYWPRTLSQEDFSLLQEQNNDLFDLLQKMAYNSFNKIRERKGAFHPPQPKEDFEQPLMLYYTSTGNGYTSFNNPNGIGEEDDSDIENDSAMEPLEIEDELSPKPLSEYPPVNLNNGFSLL